jgi:membrane protein DedA with SNARE-associated domain
MIHWLRSSFPHFGIAIVFIVTYLNSIGFPFPGEPILFGAGFILGRHGSSLWGAVATGITACFLGGESAFWLGRWLGYGRLKKIHWLHLTARKFERMEHYFKRYGAKTVFIARFIALLPPLVPNVLAGMAKMRWRVFLFYNFTGSAVYATVYILLGYFFGKYWEFLETWLGPTAIYLILQGIVLIVLAVMFRRFLYNLWLRIFFGKQ